MSAEAVVLVFGKSGQVARELANLPVCNGGKLVFVGRDDCDLLRADPGPFIRATKPSGVINAAAYTAVDQAEKEPDSAFRLNAEVVGLMATACRDAAVPFVQISTDYVFDGLKAAPYKEDDVTGPLSVYGASKLAGEQAVETAGGAWTIFRTAWLFSAFGSNFIKTMLRLATERSEVSVVADQWGRPTLASDIARMAMRAALSGMGNQSNLSGVFHLAGADDAVWADIADHVFARVQEVSGRRPILHRISSDAYPTPARRPTNSRLDTAKLQSAESWWPRPWRDTVDHCLATLCPLAMT